MWYKIKRILVWTNQVRPPVPPIPYLCFTAEEADCEIQLTKVWSPTAVTLEASRDGKDRHTYTPWQDIEVLSFVWQKVYFRNTSETDTGFSIGNANRYQFAMSWSISASGDITYLLNKNWTDTVSSHCFYRLFWDCSALTTPPTFNATTLSTSCYQQIFLRCTWLDTLPKLSATSLPDYCYAQMFNGCSKIKLSSSQTWEYQTPYRIPASWTGTDSYQTAFAYMLQNTWWTFTWDPTVNKIYYTSNTVV